MKQQLDELIGEFRSAQDQAVAFLSEHLAIPQPKTNREWVRIWNDQHLQKRYEGQGLCVDFHGYGVELKLGDTIIDFDWGENGEPDGFDAWRLYVFLLNNRADDTRTYNEIQCWLDKSLADCELTKVGSLYFDPKRRVLASLNSPP